MFADDTSISYSADSLEQLQNVMNSELKNLNEFMIVGSRQRINTNQDNNKSSRIDDHEINRVHSVKSLGLHIDSHLTRSLHIEKICKKYHPQQVL